jgi:hypothetical protein
VSTGPFQNEADARQAALELGGPPRAGWSILSADQNEQMLAGACSAAGLGLSAYERRTLAWLAGFEDSTCAVIACLITRAHESGREVMTNGDLPR